VKVELVNRREELAGLTSEWDELAQNDQRDGFFRTPAWYLSWIEHVRTDAEPYVVVVRDGAGKIVGLAPLCKLTYRDHGFRLTAISPGGREVVSGDFLDYLSVPDARMDVLNAILEFLWEMRSEWELLVAGEIMEGGDLNLAIESFAHAQKLPFRRQEERVCPYIELPRTFDDYLRGLSPKMRYEIRRDSRDLLEKFGCRIDVYVEPADVSAHLDTMIQLHLAHWRRVNEPGTMGRAGFDRFLKQVCFSSLGGAGCRLYILRHEERPAAALLAFRFGNNMMFYQTGWDPDSPIARMSPGMVLVARSIRDAIEQGCRYFDFLRGDEAYKIRLTKSSRRTTTLLVARSFLAKEYLRVARLKDSLKSLLATDGPHPPVPPVSETEK
jgi:CelD/BcsL family acetyltransferase involved in cellulose biosynthesis